MEKFNFRSIDYFLKVADTLNFSVAAEELFISQPALSKCIRQLEDEIGVTLFYRTTKKVELTEGGQLLYDEWKGWRQQTEETLQKARLLNGRGAPKIRIGLLEFGGVIDTIAPAIEAYDELHPEVEVEFEVLGFSDLRKHLKNGGLDLVISLSSEVEKDGSNFHVRKLLDLQLYIVVSKKNHFFYREKLSFRELKNETFCIFANSYSDEAQNSILKHCKNEGFVPKKLKYFPNMKTMEVALEHSDFITIGYSVFFSKNEKLKMFPIQDEIGRHELVFAWKGELNKAMTELLNYLQKELSDPQKKKA